MEPNRQLPDSKHLRLERLAEGIYAAIHQSGGAALSNAGIVDLGDRTLAFALMADAEANLDATRAQLRAAESERQRRQLALWTDFYQGLVETKPILRVRAPNVTFTWRISFHGTARSAELIDLAGGHTESDVVLFLPQDGIVFMSDLLFVRHQPYLGGGDPEALVHALEAVSALAPRLLVPGHGPVGTADCLAQMKEYIHTLDGLARQMVEAGEAEETIDAMPDPYADWLLASFFAGNMHFLYQRHLRRQGTAVA